jgi:hypothetical protein
MKHYVPYNETVSSDIRLRSDIEQLKGQAFEPVWIYIEPVLSHG